MSLATVQADIGALQDAVNAARPLQRAPALQIAALVAQGQSLLNAVEAEIAALQPTLEAEITERHPLALIEIVQAVSAAAEEQRTLSDLRGYLGRAVLNLAQRAI